jgi:hypothetical protein
MGVGDVVKVEWSGWGWNLVGGNSGVHVCIPGVMRVGDDRGVVVGAVLQ